MDAVKIGPETVEYLLKIHGQLVALLLTSGMLLQRDP